MKTLLFLPVALLLAPFPLQAQKRVGINTDQPEAELHVNGSMKFSGISVEMDSQNWMIMKLTVS